RGGGSAVAAGVLTGGLRANIPRPGGVVEGEVRPGRFYERPLFPSAARRTTTRNTVATLRGPALAGRAARFPEEASVPRVRLGMMAGLLVGLVSVASAQDKDKQS